MNKLITISTAIVLGAVTMAAIASPYGYGPRPDRVENRIERMTEQLDLTTEQQTKIKSMFEEHQQERATMRERMHKNINAVLTAEQQSKFKALRDNRQQRHARRMARHNDEFCKYGKGRGYRD